MTPEDEKRLAEIRAEYSVWSHASEVAEETVGYLLAKLAESERALKEANEAWPKLVVDREKEREEMRDRARIAEARVAELERSIAQRKGAVIEARVIERMRAEDAEAQLRELRLPPAASLPDDIALGHQPK